MPSQLFRVFPVILLAVFSGACSTRNLGVGSATPQASGTTPVTGTGTISTPTPTPGVAASGDGAWTDSATTTQGTPALDSAAHSLTGDGSITSRVFDNKNPALKYMTATATSVRPYNIPFPDTKLADTGYAAGALDMAALQNTGLYHLTATAAMGNAAAVTDASGSAHGAMCYKCTLSTGRGLFNAQAFSFNGADAYMKLGSGAAQTAPFVNGDFTVTFWMNTTVANSNQNKSTIYGQRDVTGGNYDGEWDITINNIQNQPGQIRFWIYHDDNNIASVSSTGGAAGVGWADGVWHQIVATRTTMAGQSVLTLYIDGTLNAQTTNYPIVVPKNHPVCLGGECAGGGSGNNFQGMLQELGVFGMAWSAQNAADAYLRGNPNFKFQIRACSDATCTSGGDYVGPDNTASSYFYPTTNTAGGSLAVLQNGSMGYLGGRYFQFKVSSRPFTYQGPNGAPATAPFKLTNLVFQGQ